jgi:hypothetical protein
LLNTKSLQDAASYKGFELSSDVFVTEKQDPAGRNLLTKGLAKLTPLGLASQFANNVQLINC